MKIPEYFATEPMEPQTLPRAPARQLADTGQGLKAEAKAGMGGALGEVGQQLTEIEAEKQRGRDNATLAKLKGGMDNFQFAEETAVEDMQFNDLGEFDKLEKGYGKRWDKKTQELLRGQNERVREHFTNYIQLHKDRARRNYHNKVWRKEESFGQGQGLSLYNKALRKSDLRGALFALDSHAHYFPPKELQRLKDIAPHDVEWYAGERLANNSPDTFLAHLGNEGFLKNLNPSERQRLKDEAERRTNQIIAERQGQLKIEQEKDEQDILNGIRENSEDVGSLISNSSLSADDKWKWTQRSVAEAKRRAEGVQVVTDPAVRTELYNDIMGILTGAKTKKEVIEKTVAARFDPKNPTLEDSDYSKIETAIHAQYEQAYTRAMSQVNQYAEGMLLNPDSLGYIKNAPIRYRTLGDFQEIWLQWIAEQGDKLKVSEIYPEGRRLVSMFQISDEEAERQEEEMNIKLRERESKTQQQVWVEQLTELSPTQEKDFQKWYKKWAEKTGISTDPNPIKHNYDYRAAYMSMAKPKISSTDGKYHWPSEFKGPEHPNLIVDGINTKTGEPITGKTTIIMISPEGKRWNVPVGKKQKFLDNGYTEE